MGKESNICPDLSFTCITSGSDDFILFYFYDHIRKLFHTRTKENDNKRKIVILTGIMRKGNMREKIIMIIRSPIEFEAVQEKFQGSNFLFQKIKCVLYIYPICILFSGIFRFSSKNFPI